MPLERVVGDKLIASITGHTCTCEEQDILSLPACMGGLGFVNAFESATPEFDASIKVTTLLVEKIKSQNEVLPNLEDTRALQARARKDKDECLQKRLSAIVCGEPFHVDHAKICRHGGFIIHRYNELCDLEDEMLSMVCHEVGVEPVLQELYAEVLARGANKALDTRLDVHSHGLWKRQNSAYFDTGVSYPNAESHQELSLE